MIYWFIGQPGSGKSTLARELKKYFDGKRCASVHMDGDDLRDIFGGNYKAEHFTKEYRDSNTRKLQRFVEYLGAQNVHVIVSTVNSDRSIREELKSRNPIVKEVYVYNSGPHVREERKYADFEIPETNFVQVDTNGKTIEESFQVLHEQLKRKVIVATIMSNVYFGGSAENATGIFNTEEEKESWVKSNMARFGGFPTVYVQEKQEII